MLFIVNLCRIKKKTSKHWFIKDRNYYFLRVFPISVSWWSFTGFWVTISLFGSPGLFSVFWLMLTMLYFWWSWFVLWFLMLHTYIYWIHTDAMITDARIKDARRKTQEDFFTNIFTSHFIARVRKGCWRFACERVLETEHKLHILTPLLWPSRCVFLVLLMLGSTPSGLPRAPSVGCGLPYHIWSLEVCWQLHRGFPRSPSVGCGLPYHISSLTLWESAGNCFGTPNSTELNNNSTPTRSPTGSLKSDV